MQNVQFKICNVKCKMYNLKYNTPERPLILTKETLPEGSLILTKETPGSPIRLEESPIEPPTTKFHPSNDLRSGLKKYL